MTTRRWRALAAAATAALAGTAPAQAQPIDPEPAPPSALVAGGPGNQYSATMDGPRLLWVDESAGARIGWSDLPGGATGWITDGTHWDFQPTASDGRVAFIRSSESMTTYIAEPGEAPRAVAPVAGRNQTMPRLGGDSLAWLSVPAGSGSFVDADVQIHDLVTGTTTSLGTDADGTFDMRPAISPDGQVVVWQRCAVEAYPNDCDIWKATRSGGAWTTEAVTSGDHAYTNPAADDDWIVYTRRTPGGDDPHTAAVPVDGGPERVLDVPGRELVNDVDEGVVVMSHDVEGDPGDDILAWDLRSDRVRRATSDDGQNWHPVVSVVGNEVHVGFWRYDFASASDDVWATRFEREDLGPVLAADIRPPIDADGSSVFSAKRGVVPVKFTLTSDGAPTCELPPATIRVTRLSGAVEQDVDESVYTSSADEGTSFRIADCQYQYNLGASGLGQGRYRVSALVDGTAVGSGEFALR